jgi:hypothetical protein
VGYEDDDTETDMMTVIPAGTRAICRNARECRVVLVFPTEDDTIIFYEWFLQAIRGHDQ